MRHHRTTVRRVQPWWRRRKFYSEVKPNIMVAGMADTKKEAEQPTVHTWQAKTKESFRRLTRKHIICSFGSIVIVALIITAVLVGMRLYYQGNNEQFKYKIKINEETEQVVITEGNVVQYRIMSHDAENCFIHDFDKGIQIQKVKTNEKETCFLTALNKSDAEEPSQISSTPPKMDANAPQRRIIWKVSNTTVEDVSFLGERVKKLCDKVPTYWMVPSCENDEEGDDDEEIVAEDDTNSNTTMVPESREKRCTEYTRYCGRCKRFRRRYDCRCGCCYRVCGGFFSHTCSKVVIWGRYIYVHFYMHYIKNYRRGSCRITRQYGYGCPVHDVRFAS